jgi:predicted transcriptional regulator
MIKHLYSKLVGLFKSTPQPVKPPKSYLSIQPKPMPSKYVLMCGSAICLGVFESVEAAFDVVAKRERRVIHPSMIVGVHALYPATPLSIPTLEEIADVEKKGNLLPMSRYVLEEEYEKAARWDRGVSHVYTYVVHRVQDNSNE